MAKTHYRACPLCEAICGLAITVDDDGQIIDLRGDVDDPFSRGHICPKGVALQDLQADPDRLQRPLRRVGEQWQELAWDDAFDLVASRLDDVRRIHGRNALATYFGNPSVHNIGAMLFGPRFGRALGAKNRFSATSVDQLPHHVAAHYMVGHQLFVPLPDIDRTDFMLVFGANPVVSNGSMMTAPGAKRRLKDIQKRGGKVVVIDPRRTRTAELADQHCFIHPGTDVLLLAALLQVIFEEDRVELGHLADVIEGLDTVRQVVAAFTPERVASTTGIDAETIRELARAFAAAESAVCYGRLGVSVQKYGGLCQWLIQVLNVVTGNFDRPGGAMFTNPAIDVVSRTGRGHLGRFRSRVRGLPEWNGELPSAVLAAEILTPGDGQIRALVTSAGNPVLSTPNGRQLEKALQSLDFMVSIDFYRNETTRFADVILPPSAPLEHSHYDLIFNNLAVRNVAKWSEPVFPKPDGALDDWQIFAELEKRLGKQTFRAKLDRFASRRLGPEGYVDQGLKRGPYRLSLQKLKAATHGLDLGALEPCLPERLMTPDKRLHLAPPPLVNDARRLDSLLGEPASQNGHLRLIGRRHVRSNNSWMHNAPRLMRGAERCTLLIHPDDAAARGIREGGKVKVRSDVGEVTVAAEPSDEVMPGVVSLPHGWGHGRDGVTLTVANANPGVSVNDLIDDQEVDPLCGNAAVNGVLVEVEPSW